MADHSALQTTENYITLLQSRIEGRLDDGSKWLDPALTSATNVPDGAKRWNSTAFKFEQRVSGVWTELASAYAIDISGDAATVDGHPVQTGVEDDTAGALLAMTAAEGPFGLGGAIVSGVTDANSYVTSGFWVTPIASSMVNTPTGATDRMTIAVVGRGSYIAQWATEPSSGKMWIRTASSTLAGAPWRAIWHDGNFDPADKLDATAKAADSDKLDGKDSTEFPLVAGAIVDKMHTAGVTGGDKGAGSVNAESLYIDGADATPIGVGQTWQDMIVSRASGVTYTNNTGRPITFSVAATETAGSMNLTAIIDGVTVGSNVSSISGERVSHTFVVPDGSTYKASVSGGNLSLWVELR